MRRSRVALLAVSLVAALSLVTACVDSDEEDARTPAGAATVANTAIQTDSKGETVTAPAATTPAETPPAETTPAETTPAETSGGGEEVAGDAAAGETAFAGSCGGCHVNGGQEAGVGPKLAGLGLAATRIEDQIVNGGATMPAGLASGDDLDNVVAYMVSIQ